MLNRKIALLGVVVILSLAAVVSASNGWIRQSAAQTTYLTFSGPVALPGATLGAGTYVFEVANPSTSGDVIRVSEKAHKTTYFLGFVHRVSRPEAMPEDRFVTLGEGRSGGAPRITAWFPLGESFGYRFIYHE